MSRLRLHFLRFIRGAEGSVAILFALVVLILAAGVAVDYGQVNLATTELQSAADSAVLSAVSRNLGSTASRADQATGLEQNAVASFKALAAQKALQVTNVSASVPDAPQSLAVTLNYSAAVPAIFGHLAGMQSYSVSNEATATASAPKYIDIYLLVDVSGSMSVGATLSDQQIMENIPNMNCVFGCHVVGYDKKAHQAGATLRFDVVKSGLKQIVSDAESASANSATSIRLALFSYATSAKMVLPISSNYSTLTQAVSNLQLAGYNAGTSTYYALQYVAKQITAIGDGSSAAKPLVYLLLATDGTGDSSDNIPPGTTTFVPSSNFYPAYTQVSAGAPFPHAVPDPSSPEAEFEGVDPNWCAPLKSSGINIMTLEMPYVVLPDELSDKRFNYIYNTLLPVIPTQMTQCASQPSYHISASAPSDILSAMQTLFALTQSGTPRLTN